MPSSLLRSKYCRRLAFAVFMPSYTTGLSKELEPSSAKSFVTYHTSQPSSRPAPVTSHLCLRFEWLCYSTIFSPFVHPGAPSFGLQMTGQLVINTCPVTGHRELFQAILLPPRKCIDSFLGSLSSCEVLECSLVKWNQFVVLQCQKVGYTNQCLRRVDKNPAHTISHPVIYLRKLRTTRYMHNGNLHLNRLTDPKGP